MNTGTTGSHPGRLAVAVPRRLQSTVWNGASAPPVPGLGRRCRSNEPSHWTRSLLLQQVLKPQAHLSNPLLMDVCGTMTSMTLSCYIQVSEQPARQSIYQPHHQMSQSRWSSGGPAKVLPLLSVVTARPRSCCVKAAPCLSLLTGYPGFRMVSGCLPPSRPPHFSPH